jgi:hypothetical protein
LDDSDSSITFFAYRMTIEDLLALFQAVNEGVVNILGIVLFSIVMALFFYENLRSI